MATELAAALTVYSCGVPLPLLGGALGAWLPAPCPPPSSGQSDQGVLEGLERVICVAGEVMGKAPSPFGLERNNFKAHGPFPPKCSLPTAVYPPCRGGHPCYPGQQVTGLGVVASEACEQTQKRSPDFSRSDSGPHTLMALCPPPRSVQHQPIKHFLWMSSFSPYSPSGQGLGYSTGQGLLTPAFHVLTPALPAALP